MSLERRKALLDWAAEQKAYVPEDDYDGDYRYEGRPIASLQGMDVTGRVIYIGSFNKIQFPGLRIAYAIVPEALYDERCQAFLEEAKVLEDFIDLGPARGDMHVTGIFKDSRTLRLDDRAVAAECARSGIDVHPLSK